MDAIRATAIVLMVVVHVSKPLLAELPLHPTWWWIGNVFDSLARPCVPLFFMLSGALLLSPARAEPVPVFFRKRFRRVVVPLIAWQLIYISWRVVVKHEHATPISALVGLFQGPAYYHLWFVFVLLGLYLATPVLRVFTRAATERDLRYFVLLWLCSSSLVPLLSKFSGIDVDITFFVAVGYVGYFVLGHYLERYSPLAASPTLMIAALAALLVIVFGTYHLTAKNGGVLNQFFYEYLNLAVVVASVFVFVSFRTRRPEALAAEAAGGRIVALLSSTAFGIYLIHIIVLEALSHGYRGIRITAFFIHPLVGVTVTTFLIVAISALAVLVMRRTPVLRHIV